MGSPSASRALGRRPKRHHVAAAIVVLVWLIYTALHTLAVMQRLPERIYAAVGFAPGISAVVMLLAAGFSREECYLRVASLSKEGLAVLAALFVFALAAILPVGIWTGWGWIAAFVYAPLSEISQELFFRSALLPTALATFKERPILALTAHSLLFGLWHIGPLFVGTPAPIVAAIMVVPFLSGIAWGWRVNRDGTVVWAMVQHSPIWVIGSSFSFGP